MTPALLTLLPRVGHRPPVVIKVSRLSGVKQTKAITGTRLYHRPPARPECYRGPNDQPEGQAFCRPDPSFQRPAAKCLTLSRAPLASLTHT